MIVPVLVAIALPLGAQDGALPRAAAVREPYSAARLALVRDVTEAAISPDGKRLAFVTDITGALELWTVPAEGGWPVQLSALGEQASQVEFSPDGKKVLFASDFGGDERPDLYMVDAEGGEPANITQSTRAETSPAFSPDGGRLAYLADPDRPFVFELFVRDFVLGTDTRLTFENENVHFPVWSKDGRTLAVTRSGDDAHGPLLLLDARTGEKTLVPPPAGGEILIPQSFSPAIRGAESGEKILLCLTRDEKGFFQLYLLNLQTKAGRFLTQGVWDVEDAHWNAKEGIFYTRNEAGRSSLWRKRSPDGVPERLLPAEGRIEGFDVADSGKRLAFVRSDSRRAADVWVLNPLLKTQTRATDSQLGGIKPELLSAAQPVSYPSFDGRLIHGLFLPPRRPLRGTPPPVVVVAHGGPDWQIFDDFSPMRQALAEAGFAVFAPNFRGSAGFGREFLAANRKDWGGGDRRDILEGVKYLAAKGLVDPKRAGITGGSYGGYTTLYALARNEGEWKAGAAAYGMPDLVLDYEISKDRFADWYHTQMGNPKDDAELFKERSPITYLENIKAPLLVFQGKNDTNVPLAEAELIHDRLKSLGRDVGLIVYPDEGHGFTKRKNRTDYYTRLVAFFTEKL